MASVIHKLTRGLLSRHQVKDVICSDSSCTCGKFFRIGFSHSLKIKNLRMASQYHHRAERSAGSAISHAHGEVYGGIYLSGTPAENELAFQRYCHWSGAGSTTLRHLSRVHKTNSLFSFRDPSMRISGPVWNIRKEGIFRGKIGNPRRTWQCACYEFWEKPKHIGSVG
jgi:hypothetical protein